MFAAYNQTNDDEDIKPDIRNNYATKARDQDVLGLQRAATAEQRRFQKETLAHKEDEVIQQCGYGESSDSDEGGGVRIVMDETRHQSFEQVHMAPEKRKMMEMKARREREAATREFGTFPTHATAINPYAIGKTKSSRDDSRDRRDKKHRRDRSRSRDRSRDRYRDRKRKKKHRRHSSSSSSSSSSSDGRRDRRDRRDHRDRWEKRRSPSPKKQKTSRIRYSFLTDSEFMDRNAIQNNILVTHTQYDPENYSCGQSKREIAQCRLGVRFIEGMPENKALFKKLYGAECYKDGNGRLDRPFYENLAAIAKVKPQEKYFRPVPIIDGYWRVTATKDFRNVKTEYDLDDKEENDAFFDELQRTRKAYKDNHHDVGACIKIVDMEEEMFRMNTGSFVQGDRRAHLERKESVLFKCMEQNKTNVPIRMKHVECLIEQNKCPKLISEKFRDYCQRFCHDPMVWMRYMDYVQYNGEVYTYEKMKFLFDDAFSKLEGLSEGTYVSHAHLITDRPQFYNFHLYVYIRFLKWQFACGLIPLAIANIQATFELNFGMDQEIREVSHSERMRRLKDYWDYAMPRIGDYNGVGAKMTEKLRRAMRDSQELYDMEKVEYEEFFNGALNAIMTKLRSLEAETSMLWVEFERKMLEVDARPKRTGVEFQKGYQEYKEELDGIQTWDKIPFNELNVYWNPNLEVVDCVQPLLELLGVTFLHTTGCYSMTEQVIESWEHHGDLLLDNQFNFDEVPTYTENVTLEYGKRILKFMIGQRGQEALKNPEELDEQLMKYLMALVVTEATEMEKSIKFHQLKFKKFEEMYDIEEKFAEIFGKLPKILPAVRLVAAEKFISWWERGNRDQLDIELRGNLAHRLGIVVAATDKKNLKKCQKSAFEFVDKTVQREATLKNKRGEQLQLILYSEILKARLAATDEKGLQLWLAAFVMEDVEPKDIEARSLLPEFADKVREQTAELVAMVKRTEQREQKELSARLIPELPRPEALGEAIEIVVNFAFMNDSSTARQTVRNAMTNVLQKCEIFEKRLNEWALDAAEKELDKIDVQFLLDTILRLLSPPEMQIAYNEYYKKLVDKAADLFPCHVKYMRKFTEAHSGSTLKNMQLERLIFERNRKIAEKRMDRFDVALERKQTMNSLATMFGAMRLAEQKSNPRALYEKYKREAMGLNEPAVWRLALKAAARATEQFGRAIYDEDAIIRAIGQCKWSLNIHLDHVEAVSANPPKDGSSILQKKLCYVLMNNEGMPHSVFIDEEATMDAHRDVALQNARNANEL